MKIIGFPQLFPMDMLAKGTKVREPTKKKCVSTSKRTNKCTDKGDNRR